MPTKEETREQMRRFLQMCVDQDLSAEGEHAIENWTEKAESKEYDHQFYRLDDDAKRQILDIAAEYRQAREQEEAERERRRLAEEEADRVMANHYADKMKKIVLERMNETWKRKPKSAASTRGKSKLTKDN